eukprot:GHUV01023836.1.p1 GENE.GHUV01023836.1~~GHUV01023836.1.p1  ORF type:complete len:190 (-),score=25.19 GHUV01023836.1:378-947(-)
MLSCVGRYREPFACRSRELAPRRPMSESDRLSVYSEPSHRPPGISSFSITAVVKDRQLRERFLQRDPQLLAAFRRAGYNLDAAIGALIKHSSKDRLDEYTYRVLDIYKVSCESDWGELDAAEDYIGMVLYFKDGAADWHTNGHHCKTGYIYYRKAIDIAHHPSQHGQVSTTSSPFHGLAVSAVGGSLSI